MVRIAGLLMLIAAALTAMPTAALCDMQRFIPRISEYSGEIETDMAYQSNNNKSGTSQVSSSDTNVSERLNLTVLGYVYHPRLMYFNAKISGGLEQDQAANNGAAGSWSNSDIKEYELRSYILPEHPYNLQLFISRRQPFQPNGLYRLNVQTVSNEKGAIFRYHARPLTFSTSYTASTTESNNTTNSTVLNSTASYNLEHFITSAGFTRNDISSVFSLANTQNNYSFANQIQYSRFYLLSSLRLDTYTQKNSLQIQNGSDSTWIEQMHLYLPWNFQSDLSYNRSYDGSKTSDTGTSVVTSQSNITSSRIATLTHRLYQSLSTNFTYNNTTNTSPGGRSDSTSDSLGAAYIKTIPGGVLTVGVNGSLISTQNVGSIVTLNEVHSAKATGLDSFTVQQGLINEASITIDVVSPQSAFTFLLTNNVNYRIDPLGNTFKITILTLSGIPGFTPDPDPNFVYAFKVTYTSKQGTFGLETTNIGFSARAALFQNMVNPYISYSVSDQSVTSGFYPGIPANSTNYTAGVILQKAPFSFSTEYQNFDSTVNPYTSWRSRLNFGQKLTDTINLSSGISYTLTDYSRSAEQNPYTEKVENASVALQKVFPWNINLTMSGSYSATQGLTTSDAFTFNGTVDWRVGRLYLNLGATSTYTSSAIAGSSRQVTNSALYYLRVRRQLF
jgi:hypothetical protein